MTKTHFYIEERILIQYEVRYDEDKLAETKYDNIIDYVNGEGGGNPISLNNGDVITNVEHEKIVEYIDSYRDTASWDL